MPYFIAKIIRIGDHIKNPCSHFHYTQGMFETAMGRPGINKITQGKLVNIPEPLYIRGIQHFTFVRVKTDENVNRVSYFMRPLYPQ